jgi:hypothetical protein
MDAESTIINSDRTASAEETASYAERVVTYGFLSLPACAD